MCRIKWFLETRYLKDLDRIDGEPMEFEWTIFPGFTTLRILDEIQKMMIKSKCEPCDFSDTNQGDRTEAQHNGGEKCGKQQHDGTEWNVDEGTSAREKHDPKDTRGRIGPVARARGGTMLQTSWTRPMSECSNYFTSSL